MRSRAASTPRDAKWRISIDRRPLWDYACPVGSWEQERSRGAHPLCKTRAPFLVFLTSFCGKTDSRPLRWSRSRAALRNCTAVLGARSVSGGLKAVPASAEQDIQEVGKTCGLRPSPRRWPMAVMTISGPIERHARGPPSPGWAQARRVPFLRDRLKRLWGGSLKFFSEFGERGKSI